MIMYSTTDVLQQKRKQLEYEIAEFKIQKEAEYRTFESQVLKDVHGSDGHSKLRRENEGPQDPEKSPSPTKIHFKQHQAPPTTDSAGESKRELLRGYHKIGSNSEADVDISLSADAGNLPEHIKGTQRKQQLHEREQEFQGLFTPRYLPLLDGRGDGEATSKNEIEEDENVPPLKIASHTKSSRGSEEPQATTTYSSSASFPNTNLRSSLSPPTTRPLSVSVPREPGHQRTLSARSDTSVASLRSSLRDPKQPRSPKRVLFSIDNSVVSPSTSPLAKRVNAPLETRPLTSKVASPASHPSISNTRKPTSNAWDVIPWTTSYPTQAPENVLMPGKPRTDSPLTQLYAGRIDSPSVGGDDFERIDADDELFAFDEDIHVDAERFEEHEKPHYTLDSGEEENDDENLPTSSPHAGSLPIEIKWPSRLGPSG